MANTGRPSRLLNLQKSPASNKAITAQNAATSPFLKLPPEIRQRIYGYALGGRILHVASGPMSGPNCVVVCVKCDDFNNDSDQQIIHGRRHGIRAITNRGATHSQLDSHKECYLAQEIWSLDLLKVCRQIYHEAVMVPFQQNAFAVVDGESARPLLASFLNNLVPAQAKAITHLILQGFRICGSRRSTLARLKGLQVLEFILVIEEPKAMFVLKDYWDNDYWEYFPEHFDQEFTDRKLGKLGLPQLCDIKIKVRDYTDWRWIHSDDGKHIPDGLMKWVKSVERRVKS